MHESNMVEPRGGSKILHNLLVALQILVIGSVRRRLVLN